MNFLSMLLLIFFLTACGGEKRCTESSKEPHCIAELERQRSEQADTQEAQAREKAVFNLLKECLNAKKKSAGVKTSTVQMIKECKSSK